MNDQPRIVSLLPSATEIVCELGLEDRLVGISHDCDWPPRIAEEKPVLSQAVVSGDSPSREIDQMVRERVHNGLSVYHLDQEQLRELQPDLILTQELCEVCAPSFTEVQQAARVLQGVGHPNIVSLEPTTLDEVLESIVLLGQWVGREARARELTGELKERAQSVRERVRVRDAESAGFRPRVCALEWLSPLFVGGHWIPEMIEWAGAESMGEPGEPSFQVAAGDVFRFDPDIIVLMPCGFAPERTFAEFDLLDHPGWEGLRAVERGRIFVVHGSHYFNRPGPRLVQGLEILARIIGPELFSDLELPEGSVYAVGEDEPW